VQFTDPVTHKRLPAISTGRKDRDEALIVVAGWIKDGIPKKQTDNEKGSSRRLLDEFIGMNQVLAALKRLELTTQDIEKIEEILKNRGLINVIIKKLSKEADPADAYLRRFWNYDESPYVADKRSHGVSIGKAHVLCCLARVNLYWAPYFKGKPIGEITKQDLKDFSKELAEKHPNLSFETLKQISRAGVSALRWAFNNDLLSTNPTVGLTGYTITKFKKTRGAYPKRGGGHL
jgi:hypothetical protein